MNEKIYKQNIIRILSEFSDKEYQRAVWGNAIKKSGMTISFIEAANMLFDDCVIKDYLAEGEIIISKAVTQAFQELSDVIDIIDEFRPEEDIINDPLMIIVRDKSAEILKLIAQSDGSESTVDIIE